MTIRKTFWGGLFFCIFISWAILLIADGVNYYVNNNVYETKALIPYVVLYKDYKNIRADI